ncbi:uncharacterized protein SAPINGB_P006169 [Magnusiomyces paraingens]|uniref:DNA repair protein RAD14 n=1 Tax=Magnusiomyces paraingens TaxID=2606893 RepID=A0A5E8C3M0_9ASCO|nr:uncharacterized protein SAPINGB_P006169 [Saprochaete ingens]VVT58364.1 unnamed protein product [Saprochaete ingens]
MQQQQQQPESSTKQNAMERLRAARMRMARQGVTRSVESMFRAGADFSKTATTSSNQQQQSSGSAGSGPEESIVSALAAKRTLTEDTGGVSLSQAREMYKDRPNKVQKTDTSSSSSSLAPKKSSNRDATASSFSRKMDHYIEYNFATMRDSKGGFIDADLDLTAAELAEKRAREQAEREKEAALHQPLAQLGVSREDLLKCFECGTTALDFKLYRVFRTRVCKVCRESHPEKYSLLTKTECRTDYLLTDPELRDEELLPHLERPNPHKATFNNMMLYMRYQVEEFAFRKWGGEEGLDAEYERRVAALKARKEKKFLEKLQQMRRTTRASGKYSGKGENGKDGVGRHTHEWSAALAVENPEIPGTVRRRCAICGMMTEEVQM